MADAKSDRSFYRNYYREIDVLHGLQSAPEERDWLLTTPKDSVKQSDIVLYLGCNVMRTTHLVRTVMDVFKLLGVDFARWAARPTAAASSTTNAATRRRPSPWPPPLRPTFGSSNQSRW